MKRPIFIKALFKDPDIGALAATSRWGVQRICDKIDQDNARVIVEYGPGTGVITEYVLENFTNIRKLILIEKNDEFYNFLMRRISDHRVCIFNDRAENIVDIIQRCREPEVDYIISGIPFSYFDDSLKLQILMNTRKVLSESGKFLVYQNRKLMFEYLQEIFSNVRYEFEIRNFLPLYIFEASK